MLLVDFINVGYGDAILLRETETPFAMLVDCGDARIGRSRPDGRRITAADYLRREGIRELDLLVLTHLHLDHAGGLTHLLPGSGCGNSGPTTSRRRRCGAHTPGSAGSSSRRPVSDDLYGDLCKSPGSSAKPEDGDPADPDAL
ncbi:MAG: MBL fold metallo-hydrolase [Dysosmobacter welbionis]